MQQVLNEGADAVCYKPFDVSSSNRCVIDGSETSRHGP